MSDEIKQFNLIIDQLNEELKGIDEEKRLLILELFYLFLENPQMLEALKEK